MDIGNGYARWMQDHDIPAEGFQKTWPDNTVFCEVCDEVASGRLPSYMVAGYEDLEGTEINLCQSCIEEIQEEYVAQCEGEDDDA